MKPLQRGMLALIALLLTPLIVFGQDENSVTAVGSGIVLPLVEQAVEATGAAVTVNVTGTNSGFSTFCRGEADLMAAARPMSVEEEAACASAGVQFAELLLGYNIVAFVTNPADTSVQCLSLDQVRQAFAPSAAGQIVDWAQLGPEFASQPLSLAAPPDDTPSGSLLNSLVGADGLRNDAARPGDATSIITAVSGTPGTLGVVPYNDAVAAGDSVRILQLSSGQAGCIAPTPENLDADLYGGAQRLFAYANVASLTQPGLTDVLTDLSTDSAADAVQSAGYALPSQEAYDANSAALANPEGGRQFSGSSDSYTISNAVAGTVTIAGSPAATDYFTALTGGFSSQYPGVTFTPTLEGDPDGIRRLCNGEIDIAAVTGSLNDDQQANCAANNIELVTIDLGSQVVTLLANSANTDAMCLSTNQINTIWRASESAPTNWNQVDAAFADRPLILVAPLTNATTDLLLALTSDQPAIDRIPAETNDDPLYRAAAVGNVEGGISYFNWSDFQQANGQTNVTPISVRAADEGAACVAPSLETIEDGSYPLSRPVRLVVNRAALNRPEVQGILWYAAQELNFSFIEDSGFVGLQVAELGDLRTQLEATFAEVAAEALAVVPESTAEPETTAEATAEATEAEGQITEEAPASEVTAEATAGS